MKEKTTSYICISDLDPEAFKALLCYIYTNTLPELQLSSWEEGAVLAEGLLMVADQYNLKDLKTMSENKMCKHIEAQTVLPMLALAEQHQCRKLKKKYILFIAS
ncbi:hypothetical protein PR202_ga28420 [Eleusine coracana subsp. coracana]|uniref:BTB domain-containing protein n=1 Tax=Eleusine coracana subsp. coracana TaxID=191504 RepID=A0AAV5DH29_ELECO|nr:hypothetical protein PR202_ga28420 [Eleusine coracana subsp. coracana]